MKALRSIIGIKKRILHVITCLAVIVLFLVGCSSEDPDPAPMPVLTFPIPLVPSMAQTQWQNENSLPAGSVFMVGYNESGIEEYKTINLEKYTLRFIDSVNVNVRREVYDDNQFIGFETFHFYYTFLRYEKKGVLQTSSVGIHDTFKIDNSSGIPHLTCEMFRNTFNQIPY